MNLIPDIAESLGVKTGEAFNVRNVNSKGFIGSFGKPIDFYFSEKALNGTPNAPIILMNLMNGDYEVVKKPFKPKKGDKYWYVVACNVANKYTWNDDVVDFIYYKSGNCFRTEEEALFFMIFPSN